LPARLLQRFARAGAGPCVRCGYHRRIAFLLSSIALYDLAC